VHIFGSRARGDHTDESDLDLLVVLADPVDKWHEMRVMDDVLWRHTLDSGIVVSAMAVGSTQWHDPRTPVLLRAAAEGVRVA
jgi:predicted nucleotidyltransferase